MDGAKPRLFTIEDMLSYLEGALPAPAAEELEEHIAACRACAETMRRLFDADDLLVGWTAAAHGDAYRRAMLGWVPSGGPQPPAIVHHPGAAYADAQRRFQGIPGIERAPQGRLWAVWYSGGDDEGPENYVLLVTSADDGRTWSEPLLAIDPPGDVRAFDPCLWLDPTGRLWLVWAQSYMDTSHWAGVWAITTREPDAADPSWTSPRRLCDGIMMNKPTVLSTGEWLLPASVWRYGEDRIDPEAMRGANVLASSDEGLTWVLRGQVQVPNPLFDEHMIIERRDGSLWMLVRTLDGIAESVSHDRGATWTPGWASYPPSPLPLRQGEAMSSGLEHTSSRFFIRRLQSGRLLLVKHTPPDRPRRSHLTAYLSDDDGTSWLGGLLLDEREGVSYPDGTQARDGTIYVIYDYARQGDKTILMATFTEADVETGTFASPAARRRVLVNQATGVNRAVR